MTDGKSGEGLQVKKVTYGTLQKIAEDIFIYLLDVSLDLCFKFLFYQVINGLSLLIGVIWMTKIFYML